MWSSSGLTRMVIIGSDRFTSILQPRHRIYTKAYPATSLLTVIFESYPSTGRFAVCFRNCTKSRHSRRASENVTVDRETITRERDQRMTGPEFNVTEHLRDRWRRRHHVWCVWRDHLGYHDASVSQGVTGSLTNQRADSSVV
jgi:hypothetical protein